MKSKIWEAKEKGMKAAGLEVVVKLVFICEGCLDDPHTNCNRSHDGFSISLPGENMKKIAPALLMGAKILSVAFKGI